MNISTDNIHVETAHIEETVNKLVGTLHLSQMQDCYVLKSLEIALSIAFLQNENTTVVLTWLKSEILNSKRSLQCMILLEEVIK